MRIVCDQCHERTATVHLTNKVDGHPDREMHLCNVCCPLNRSEKEDQQTLNKFLHQMSPPGHDDRP